MKKNKEICQIKYDNVCYFLVDGFEIFWLGDEEIFIEQKGIEYKLIREGKKS